MAVAFLRRLIGFHIILVLPAEQSKAISGFAVVASCVRAVRGSSDCCFFVAVSVLAITPPVKQCRQNAWR